MWAVLLGWRTYWFIGDVVGNFHALVFENSRGSGRKSCGGIENHMVVECMRAYSRVKGGQLLLSLYKNWFFFCIFNGILGNLEKKSGYSPLEGQETFLLERYLLFTKKSVNVIKNWNFQCVRVFQWLRIKRLTKTERISRNTQSLSSKSFNVQ